MCHSDNVSSIQITYEKKTIINLVIKTGTIQRCFELANSHE